MPQTANIRISVAEMLGKRRKFFETCTAFRLSHYEIHPRLTVDYYAGYLLFTCYDDFPGQRLPRLAEEISTALAAWGLEVRGAIKKFRPENLSQFAGREHTEVLQPELLAGAWPPERFTMREHDLQFVVSFHAGFSTGIFLDIKNARQSIRQFTKPGDEVLNLFSYTGGFSIAAARAGAARVIEVDSSGQWLKWAQENQALNGVSTVRQRKEDAVKFLRKQKQGAFDFIICDPPTYSSQKSGARFTLERGFREMIPGLHRILRPGGHLLASTNYRGLARANFFKLFAEKFSLQQEIPISEDFVGDDYLKIGLFRKNA